MLLSQPVDETRWFGRAELLALLGKRVHALRDGYRQNVALLGPPLVGKTSLICQALKRAPAHALIPLYLDVRLEPFAEFAHRFLAAGVAQALGAAPAQSSADTLELLLRDAAGRLPQTTAAAQRLRTWTHKGRHTEAFGGLFDWLQTIVQETGKPVLVALDEFDRLTALDVRHPLAELGRRIMIEKRVMYLLASSQPAARVMLQEQFHLLFGHFEVLDVPPFDPATSQAFLRQQLGAVQIGEELLTFLAAWTGGHPFYLDHFAQGLLREARARQASVVASEELYVVAQQLLCDRHGALHQHWQQQLQALEGPQYPAAQAALAALARGRLTVRELGRRCQCSAQEAQRLVNRLTDRHLIVRRGACLSIDDPLFRFWLASVHEPLRWSPVPHCGGLARRVVLDVDAAFRQHQQEHRRPPTERLIELLHCFQDDRVQVGQHVRQLPRFVDVRQNGAHPWGVHVHAATRQHQWMCCVKDRLPATESDVAAFEQACRTAEAKPQRKIFVALEGLEPNATLLAKEARMWTWDLRTVNTLLGLYHKQPITP